MRVSFAIEPGCENVPNEDWVIATSRIVVVLDGVTAPAGLETGCIHGTAWYVEQLGAQIVIQEAMARDLDLRGVLASALSNVAASHAETCDLQADGTPSATVAILREGQDSLDYLVLSDATITLDVGTETLVVTDNRGPGLFNDLRVAAKAARARSAEREARLVELVTAQRKLRNVEGGYWLAGATPQSAEHAITGSIPLAHVRSAAAMTDGAARLVDMFATATWADAIRMLRRNGPTSWISQVRQMEETDAALVKWPRYKMSDDAAIALVELAQVRPQTP